MEEGFGRNLPLTSVVGANTLILLPLSDYDRTRPDLSLDRLGREWEGFRMPADGQRGALRCRWAGVRKAPKNETAGSGARSCRVRYGDLSTAEEVSDGNLHHGAHWLMTLLRMIGPPQVQETALRHED